MLLFD
jgi:hypothetical protein